MKKEKRIFNFNLPDELRNYLKKQVDVKNTTISQYLIDLIVKDKETELNCPDCMALLKYKDGKLVFIKHMC